MSPRGKHGKGLLRLAVPSMRSHRAGGRAALSQPPEAKTPEVGPEVGVPDLANVGGGGRGGEVPGIGDAVGSRFEIPGPIVPWERTDKGRRGQVYTPPRTREYQAKVRFYAMQAGLRPIQGPVSWWVWIYVPDARRRDSDNMEKTLRDALNGIAYLDDSQIKQWGGSVEIDREHPRVVVQVGVLP